MPPKFRRFAQTKHQALLFVNTGQHNVKAERSLEEQVAIKQHLSRLQQKRNQHEPLSFDPSTQRILKQDKDTKDKDKRHAVDLPPRLRLDAELEDAEFNASHAPVLSKTIGTTVLDPFASQVNPRQDNVKLLHRYLQHVRPLAATVCPSWDWIDNVAEIQASEMLSNAVAAYTTAFFDGLKDGSQGIVLPPLPQRRKTEQPLWDLPPWFQYYHQCLSQLNEVLSDSEKASRADVYHAVLFLLRLTVLFGDGPSANMHYKALRKIAQLQGKTPQTLSQEASVTQVNFITLFLYKAAMMKRANKQITSEHPSYMIEPDRAKWADQREWTKFAGMIYGRSLTWHAKALGAFSIEEAQQIILRMEPDSEHLSAKILQDVAQHYQISLFLWSYLVGINYDPSLPKIKAHVHQIEAFVRSTDTDLLAKTIPKVLFFIYFCGVYSSRDQPSRRWFIQKLDSTSIQVHTMRDLWAQLENHADPAHCMPVLLEEILYEMGKKDIYSGGRYEKWYGRTPINYEPDLRAPIREITG